MFDLSGFACEGIDFEDRLAVESFVVVVDDISHVVSCCFLANSVNVQLFVSLSYTIVGSFVSAIVVD